jgi:uncharacterized coiled-coil DUF342 family protein
LNYCYKKLLRNPGLLKSTALVAPIQAKPIKLPQKFNSQTLPKKQTDDVAQTIRIDDNPYIKVDQLPPDLQKKYKEIKRLKGEQNAYFERLKARAAGSNTDTQDLAKIIVEIADTVREYWSEIDTWYANKDGEKADKKPELDTKKLKMYVSRWSCSTNPGVVKKVEEAKAKLAVAGIIVT